MESIFSLIIFAAVFILLLLKLKRRSQRGQRPRLPPGPWQLPVLGSIHHLILSSQKLPHRRFLELSKSYGPLMHLKLGEVSMVVASSPEAARELMKTHDVTFAGRPLFPAIDVFSYGGKSMTFAPYGEYWRQLRKIAVLELLSAKRVLSFQFIREEEAQCLIHSISLISQHGSLVNLSKMLVEMTNNMTMRAAIGNRFKDQDRLLEAIYDLTNLISGFDSTDVFPSLSGLLNLFDRTKSRVEKCHQKLDLMLESVLQEHKVNREAARGDKGVEKQIGEDLVDVLLRIREDGELQFELTDESIKAFILDVFGAGSESSSTTVAWAMSELMKNPAVMRKVQREVRDALRGKDKVTEADVRQLNYLQLVIKETLRLHPPGPLLLPRECRKKCRVMGYDVPAKTRVVINAWAIGRDPISWEDANEFKPERFEASTAVDFRGSNFEFLPFGAGRRMCPGMLFALAMIDLPLAQLLYYFDWELPAGVRHESLDMSETFGISARRRIDLCLHATCNVPCPMVLQ